MIFDIIVLAIVVISCAIAFWRGFIREVLTILGVLGGVVAALALGPVFAPVMRGWFGVGEGTEEKKFLDMVPYDLIADVCAYGAIFVVVVIALTIVSHFLAGWARAIGLGAVDRTFGVMFGMVRAAFLLILIYTPIYLITDVETRDGWFESSRVRPYAEKGAEWFAGLLPKSMSDDLTAKAEDTANSVAETTRQKLMNMDVLEDDRDDDAEKGAVNFQSAEGYDEGQRDTLDRLIIDENRAPLNE